MIVEGKIKKYNNIPGNSVDSNRCVDHHRKSIKIHTPILRVYSIIRLIKGDVNYHLCCSLLVI